MKVWNCLDSELHVSCKQGGFFENLGSVMFLTLYVLRGKCHVSTLDVLFFMGPFESKPMCKWNVV